MAAPVPSYPPIEPFDTGMLDVGDGQLVYYEQCGNPAGKPLVLVHGGPGGGWSVNSRRMADPAAYRIVLYDQRGCGRSTPHAAEHDTSLATNTTSDLIADLERLRAHLGIERWLVFGASWGTTLGLAYAEQFPQRVTELILAAVALTRRADVDWLYGGLRRFLPEEWARYRDAVPAGLRDGDLTQVYDELLNSADPAVRQRAADAWMAWEDAVVSLDNGAAGTSGSAKRADPRYRLAFARLCAHYFSHGAWLAENQLIEQAHRVHGIPGLLVHGRFDPQGPLEAAWQLARAWPDAELVVVENAGHTSPAIGQAIVAATDRFRPAAGDQPV
ncbi:MAG: proline iminopeptidase [Pseudonocardiales bacterium]|jgi:proline iminopeptidase|nr:proline iminopeptidase [Pseudonocardiales bacterium]